MQRRLAPEPPKALLARVIDHDAVAARELYELHASHVYSVAYRLLGDAILAADAAQDAWMQIFRGLPAFRGESSFSLWMHRIAVNAALYVRRKRRRFSAEEALHESLPIEGTQEADVDNGLLATRIESALLRLPDGMRSVLVLHDIEGYTHDEIGNLLGITTGTSKSQLFKARARMRAMLGPKEKETTECII